MRQKVRVVGPHKDWFRVPPRIMAISYCPGCQGATAARVILLEVLEEMNLIGEAIAVNGVGCNSPLGALMNVDFLITAHGRLPDAATAIKHILKDRLVFTIQGDDDCVAIGAGSLISAAIRGEKITIIMLNNTNYGTTGGADVSYNFNRTAHHHLSLWQEY